MNRAMSEPPNPKPTRIADEVFWKMRMMMAAPNSPRPTVNIPAMPPVRNATLSAAGSDPARAAAAVRTFPRTARLIPMKPVRPDIKQPARNARVRNSPDAPKLRASEPFGFSTEVEVAKTTTMSGSRMRAIVLNCRVRYARAPS